MLWEFLFLGNQNIIGRGCWWQNYPAAIVITSNRILINALQWILIPPAKKMSGWVVRTHPPMIKLVFWKLLENRVFLSECYSVIFVKDAYLPKSLLRVYIWVREYGSAVLAGPIVMIATHRVAKQSWRFWCKVAVVASIYDFKYRGCIRHIEKIWEYLVEHILH